MPLSAEEEQELAQLSSQHASAQAGGLSADEEHELAQLQQHPDRTQITGFPGLPGYKPIAHAPNANVEKGLKDIAALGNKTPQQEDVDRLRMALNVGPSVASGLQNVNAGPGLLDKASGTASRIADKMQQTAMGMKKDIPGAGTEAIGQGVRGTLATMQEKMSTALENQGKETDTMIAGLKGSVSSESVANKVADYGEKYISPGGYSTEAGFDRANDAFTRASDINMRGEVSPGDARGIAQAAEKAEGYSPVGTPKANYDAKLAQQEAQGYRDELRRMGAEQGVPISEKFKTLSNLLRGQKALNAPQTIDWNSPITSLGRQALKETVARPEIMSYGAAGLENVVAPAIKSNAMKNASQIGLQKLLMRNQE